MNKIVTLGLIGVGAWWLLSSAKSEEEQPEDIEITITEGDITRRQDVRREGETSGLIRQK